MNDKPDMRLKENRPKLKKGTASWTPASVLDVVGKEDGYRYRWANKNPDNIAKKQAEQWEIVSALQADSSSHTSTRIQDGKQITSTREKHDCVLMRLPEEVAQARDEYINNESARRTAGLTSHIKKEVGKSGGNVHGNITISSLRGEQILE